MATLLELQHFAVLELFQHPRLTAIKITCETNNPCHLTCYYTDRHPVRHATSIISRGLSIPWGAYFCFVAYHSIEQQEDGYTLIHTFEVPDWAYCQTKWISFTGMVPGPIPTYDFAALEGIAKVWEPWGETLIENYPWLPFTIPDIPEWSLENGILTLTNPGYADCGIVYSPPYLLLPILDPDGQPLTIMVDNPDVSTNSSSTQIHHELIFRSLTEVMSIYLAISLGAEWDYYKPQHHTVISGRDCGIFWIGPGYHNIDLYQLFIKFRSEFGKSPDPTGWWLNDIVFVMSLGEEHRTDYLKSNYIALYHPPLPVPTPVLSPSVGPLIKKHYGFLVFESLNVSYSAYWGSTSPDSRAAQTFTPQEHQTIVSVRIPLRRTGAPGTITVSVQATDASGHPTGLDLTLGTTDGNTLPSTHPGEWRFFDLSPLLLIKNTKYAIVIRSQQASVLWPHVGGGQYPLGQLLTSGDAGGTWNPTGRDFIFECWGIPA